VVGLGQGVLLGRGASPLMPSPGQGAGAADHRGKAHPARAVTSEEPSPALSPSRGLRCQVTVRRKTFSFCSPRAPPRPEPPLHLWLCSGGFAGVAHPNTLISCACAPLRCDSPARISLWGSFSPCTKRPRAHDPALPVFLRGIGAARAVPV